MEDAQRQWLRAPAGLPSAAMPALSLISPSSPTKQLSMVSLELRPNPGRVEEMRNAGSVTPIGKSGSPALSMNSGSSVGPNNRESPVKRGPPCGPVALDHRECGRTGNQSQVRSSGDATKQRPLPWSLPILMCKTVLFFVSFRRRAMQAWVLFLVSIERGTPMPDLSLLSLAV